MVIHVSDLHVGARPYGMARLRDHILEAFDAVVEHILRERPDLVVVAGDLFDVARPEYEILIRVLNNVKRITSKGIPVVAAHGEHDTPGRRDKTILEVISEAVDGFYAPRPSSLDRLVEETVLSINGATVAVFPFIRAHGEKRKKIAQEVLAPAYKSALSGRPRPRILLGHFSVEEVFPIDAILSTSQLPEVEYAALGHVHKRYIGRSVGSARALAYPGSLYPLDISEARNSHKRGPLLVDLSGDEPVIQELEVEVSKNLVLEPVDVGEVKEKGARIEDVLRRRIMTAVRSEYESGKDLVVYLEILLDETTSPRAVQARLERLGLPSGVILIPRMRRKASEKTGGVIDEDIIDHARIIMEAFGISEKAAREILELKDLLASDEPDPQRIQELLESLAKRNIDKLLEKLLPG